MFRFVIIALGASLAIVARDASGATGVQWGAISQLPDTIGVARPFAGVSNGEALLAGGANFPEASLADGGAKQCHDKVWGLPVGGDSNWREIGRLPYPCAEGGSATTAKGIVCVSGAIDYSPLALTNGCFLLKWDAAVRQLRTEELPPFPVAAQYVSAASHGDRVYAVASRMVAVLDLSACDAGWQRLPDLPEDVCQPACAVQHASNGETALFVFAEHGVKGLSGGWKLALEPEPGGMWSSIADIPSDGAMADRKFVGAVAHQIGDQHVLFVGGTSRACERESKGMGRETYLRRPNEWFRFADSILVYHTVTDRWFELGRLPFAGVVGAGVIVLDEKRLLVVGGEVGPGVRTPNGAVASIVRATGWHWINSTIVVAYLLAMAFIGFWFMRRNRNADDYFKGGGKLPWWAVSLSIYATMFSSITFLSVPALVYQSDCRYFGICFGVLLLAPVVTHFYLPFFRKLNLTSAYEYLEVRFNLACRLFASAAFILFMIARTAIVTYLPAIALSAVIGVDVNVSVALVTLVTILYCTVGGVEAVIWSDFVQSVILILGTLVIYVFLVTGTEGGWSGFVSMGLEAGKFRVFDLALDWSRPVFWVVFVGGIVANLASYTSDQCVVQRYMTTTNERGAAKSILFNGVLSTVNNIVFFTLGVALWTFYRSHPQLLDVTMPKNDAVFPLFIGHDLPVGVSGLILAAVAAATMSTLSANLNAAASAFTTDFYKRFGGRRLLTCGKVSTMTVGLAGGMFALVLANMDVQSIYDQFQRFLGILTGGLGCLFFMGIFMKRVNAIGATTGLVANYVVCFMLDAVAFPGRPHLLLFGALGMLTCLAVAAIVSRMTKKELKTYDWK